LDLASRANSGQECAVRDFGKSLLEVTRFDERGTILCTRYVIPFTVCGDSSKATKTDICLVHLNSMILLVVQEDKTSQSLLKPEAQVIAEAIATFQHNNEKRFSIGLQPLDLMTIPCITMVETRPFFYRVPVIRQLSDAVATGQYPLDPTIVTCCARPARRREIEGMDVPDYRQIALQYYDAFRGLARSCWTQFLS
jgi:hypothetical protein